MRRPMWHQRQIGPNCLSLADEQSCRIEILDDTFFLKFCFDEQIYTKRMKRHPISPSFFYPSQAEI